MTKADPPVPQWAQPVPTQPPAAQSDAVVWPSVEAVARKICLSYGSDPDELASILEICTADNKPLPRWRLYEEQAEAVAELYATPPASPAAQSEAVAWLIERKDGYVEITRHKEAADGWASVAKITPLGPLATPPASPARDDIAEVLKRFHRNSCYPDASPGEVEIGVDAVLAALASQGATRGATETAICTLCAKIESSGFYTGCLIKDGHDCNGWQCDGNGNLTREATASRSSTGTREVER